MVDPYRMVVINVIAVILLAAFICIYTFIYPKKRINLLFLLILISLLPLISLLRKGTYESGLLSENALVTYSFLQTLKEGILNPMWSERACSGFGCPLFIFQYKLPFYIASFFHFLGFSVLSSLKMLIAVSFVASGITMYYWAKSETNKIAGFVAALFYLFAPYHLSTMHFRVSIGEIVSYVFPPLILFSLKKITESRKSKWIVLSAVSLTLLVLSHQATAMLCMPFFITYIFVVYLRQKKKNPSYILFSLLSLLLGILLSAFYWLPLLIEGKYIQIALVKDVIFQPFWYYIYSPFTYRFGLLFQGQYGELYTNIGYIVLLLLGISFVLYLRNRIVKSDRLLYIYLLVFFLFYFIMMQSITRPIWQAIPFLLNLQFSWRFLIEISFITSLIAALVVKNLHSIRFTILISSFVVLITILNWGNRKTLPNISDSAFEKAPLYRESPCMAELTTPIWVNTCAPWVGKYPSERLEILEGKMNYRQISRSSITHSYIVDLQTNGVIKENTYFFPGWRVYANGQEIPVNFRNKKFPGIITFSLNRGLYKIDVIFTKTPERRIGETISSLTFISLLLILLHTPLLTFMNQRLLRKMKSKK